RAEQAAADDAARDARRVDLLDTELHAAIVEEDATAGQDVPGEVRVRGRDLAGLGDGFRREDDEVARVELHGVREHAGPDLRAGEVGEDRERLVQRVRGLAGPADDALVLLVGAVCEVDANDIDAGRDEGADLVRFRGRGT